MKDKLLAVVAIPAGWNLEVYADRNTGICKFIKRNINYSIESLMVFYQDYRISFTDTECHIYENIQR